MANANGYVRVYESTDGGTGKPEDTTWMFFVGADSFATANPFHAETIRFAIKTNNRVMVTYDETNKSISQVRMEFSYICQEHEFRPCRPDDAGDNPLPPKTICETYRYQPCVPRELEKLLPTRSPV
ncbi:MAG: hypothetical protein SGI88_21655 [Candidatus Hydrogenedentes bacterium]|nr:hypothetical protein [Candidatus Hydrogenedentota bacterium]